MSTRLKTTFAILDDHPILRRGLSALLDSEPGFEVVAQFDRAEELLHDQARKGVDVIIADISLPGMSGLELIKHLVARDPEVVVIVISRHDELLYAERAIRAGAKGYLMKLEASEVLIRAVRKVLNGGIYLSDRVSEKLLMGMAYGGKIGGHSPVEQLSDRELEVFELTGQGNTTRHIADQLHLSVKTVESYRARIKAKLNLESATELMVHAVKWVQQEKPEAVSETGAGSRP